MTDYHSPTVVQPDLAVTDMTPLEYLVLRHMFEHEETNGEAYFFSTFGIDETPAIDVVELHTALARSWDRDSRLNAVIEDLLSVVEVEPGAMTVDLTASHYGSFPETIFQDVVRRTERLDYVTLTTSYTCTKMRPDGFGGCATLVNAHRVMSRTTEEILAEFVDLVSRAED